MLLIGLAVAVRLHHENPIILFWTVLSTLLLFGVSFGAWLQSWREERSSDARQAYDTFS